jgi:mannose-6-phosphate isomerase-like protein (cupin superfamily)
MSRRVEKPWGHEEIWAETSRYVGKILFIRKDHRLSLQHHEVKDETIRVASGTLSLELEDDEGNIVTEELSAGQSVHIRPGHRHRMRAVTDVEIFEVSTPELDDVVRHSDDYGRVDAGPSEPNAS